ncbi:ribosomal protein S5 domain 2-type protein [Xylogone sp. PMI_703]|nr:ribosomal protein S5 domain 2-type protein [Xylogone sp. PMI_703]
MPTTAVSAPGKVLLAGGYLVLDRTYTGLVFGLSARIHVLVQDIQTTTEGVELSEIAVRSPQFKDAVWNYGYYLAEEDGGMEVTQIESSPGSSSRNLFIETALSYALTYISSVLPSHTIKPASVTILADNDYYSQPNNNGQAPTTPFTSYGIPITQVHKTGLGSSAALVTAFTGAILSHYLSRSHFDLSTPQGLSMLHNLSQASHCAAQGKVGSGFDVAAAVYGSCIYRRFSPRILENVGVAGERGFRSRVKIVVEEAWDVDIAKESVRVPSGYALRMCDVDCGSQTVGMVKQVLAWRKEDGDGSKRLWDELQARNEELAAALSAATPAVEDIAKAFAAVREKNRDMGSQSKVPIEPPEQSALLDALTELEGVVGGVVPGAGGYDAVCLLVKDDEETTKRLEAFLEKWSKENGGSVKLLETRGETQGVRLEDGGRYVQLF